MVSIWSLLFDLLLRPIGCKSSGVVRQLEVES
jgi:hypothetical protein